MKNASAPRLLDIAAVCALAVLALAPVGCTNRSTSQNDQEIRQKSAEATRDAQKAAKQLAANAKVAAANAVDGVNAATQGVKDGMNSKQGENGDRVDINSASTVSIAMLPGISITKAHEIVKGRPYRSPRSLVQRGLLTQEQYDRVADKITAQH